MIKKWETKNNSINDDDKNNDNNFICRWNKSFVAMREKERGRERVK